MSSRRDWTAVAPTVVGAFSFLLLAAHILAIAGRPVQTSDLWWHLSLGEAYAKQGLWLDRDPTLFTATKLDASHEWLFSTGAHLLRQGCGFHALRFAHLLGVALVIVLAWSAFRREAGSRLAVFLALSVFLGLTSFRLIQLRPHLLSMLGMLLIYRLLLEPIVHREESPTWCQIAAAAGVMIIWANVHSVFAVAVLFLLVTPLGLGIRALMGRRIAPQEEGAKVTGQEGRHAARVTLALVLCVLASVLNPGGIGRYAAFVQSSGDGGIWLVLDDWAHFDPLRWERTLLSMSFASWAAMDLLILGFVLCSIVAFICYMLRPSTTTLRASDPLLIGFGVAGLLAIAVSVRFLWLAFFPLLFMLRFERLTTTSRPQMRRPLQWGMAALCVVLVTGQVDSPRLRQPWKRIFADPAEYLRKGYSARFYHSQGVRFLSETEVEGNVFNPYTMGGFFGYWLAPRLRLFIDGRTPGRDTLLDYLAINRLRGRERGQSNLDLLDRYGVDLFFGVGMPTGRNRDSDYTTTLLEDAPGWMLVFRTVDQAIYLRRTPRNRRNLQRISAWYAREGVPFDLRQGLDVGAVVLERPDWAERHQLLPRHHAELEAASRAPDTEQRFAALSQLATVLLLQGRYEEQVELDLRAHALRPHHIGPRRRLVVGLLRLGRPEQARQIAGTLLGPEGIDDGASFVSAAELHLRERDSLAKRVAPPRDALNRLPVLSKGQANRMLDRHFVTEVPLERVERGKHD